MARLNLNAEELPSVPVTLPVFRLPDIDTEAEAREAAERIAERRVIRAGHDAWQAISKAETFDGWKAIGAALSVGKQHALRITGANAPMGRAYSETFSHWVGHHGFSAMPKMTRSWAIALFENADAIERWKSRLPAQEQRRLKNPQSLVRKWRLSTHSNSHTCPADLKRYAITAWKRFLVYVEALPATDQAALWRMVHQTKAVIDVAA
jgi:hypothetical protein